MQRMPGNIFTFCQGCSLVKKSGVIVKSRQVKSKIADSFWFVSPFLTAPSWSSSKYFNRQLQSFLATFLTTSYSVCPTLITRRCFVFLSRNEQSDIFSSSSYSACTVSAAWLDSDCYSWFNFYACFSPDCSILVSFAAALRGLAVSAAFFMCFGIKRPSPSSLLKRTFGFPSP